MGTTKRPVKTFSGAPTSDLGALHEGLLTATRVKVYRDGCLVYAVRPQDDVCAPETPKWVRILSDEPIATSTGLSDVDELRAALRVTELQDFACMCPGDLALEFLDDGGRPVEVVRVDLPDTLDWYGWEGKAQLADPELLAAWLERHGVGARR